MRRQSILNLKERLSEKSMDPLEHVKKNKEEDMFPDVWMNLVLLELDKSSMLHTPFTTSVTLSV